MNSSRNSCSVKPSEQNQVLSKYFIKNKEDMDESLNDFKESRKNFKGPKETKKLASGKSKTRVKKDKKQKDIRTALKAQKNDLVSYSTEFRNVCLESGVDVDSEQLQIAIALSESLLNHEHQPETITTQISEESTNTDRINKIKSTLLEYGFKVPTTKRTAEIKKKVRKCRKNSKLLQTTEEEKRQKVADRVAQILFEISHDVSEQTPCIDDEKRNNLFNFNGKPFFCMQDEKCFYTGDLLECSPNTIGCLLKDWSAIPGRPKSPPPISVDHKQFTDYVDSQTDLDILLSGVIKIVKMLAASWNQLQNQSNNEDERCNETNDIYTKVEAHCSNNIVYNSSTPTQSEVKPIVTRTVSPDLFDDDPSISEFESSYTRTATLSENYSPQTITSSINLNRPCIENIIDLTECVKPISQNNVVQAHRTDTILKNNSPTFDLTQSSGTSEDSLPGVHLSSQCVSTTPKTPFLEIEDVNNDHDKCSNDNSNGSNVDLTQSSNGSPEIIDCGDNISTNRNVIFDDFLFHHSSMSENNSSKEHTHPQDLDDDKPKSLIINKAMEKGGVSKIANVGVVHSLDPVVVDLNVSLNSSLYLIDENSDDQTIEYSKYDFISSNTSKDVMTKQNLSNVVASDELIFTEDINYTQDKIINPVNVSLHTSNNLLERNSSGNEPNINCSQNSAVFKISDEELDYSMQYFKSCKHNSSNVHADDDKNYEDNCSSPKSPILKEISALQTKHCSFDTSLPAVEIKGTKVKIKSPEKYIPNTPLTPIPESLHNELREDGNAATPSHSGYIIKTTNVTPMLDYNSLDTPERNRELEKYGIKPFKRKRAIQLLEYLYCQTHPIMVNCDAENMETPTKRPKLHAGRTADNAPNAEQNNAHCEKQTEHTEKDLADNLEVYEVRSERPVLTNIACDAADWIFQKREKAKVHGCRVPLHVAFHNYVSARPLLRKAILRYEPISIDVVHKELASAGYRYDPKDLLRFLDSKCITVKTADNNTRNKRQERKS